MSNNRFGNPVQGGAGGGAGLTETQKKTLGYFKYNPLTNNLEAYRTIATEPSTVQVGNHDLTSGGENLFITNRSTNIDFYPAWAGLKDQSLVENQDETGIIPPTFRHPETDLIVIDQFGAPDVSGSVDYNADSVVFTNLSIYGQEVIVDEVVEADDWLFFQTRRGGASDPVVYQQIIKGSTIDATGLARKDGYDSGTGLTAGQRLIWWFDHPIEGFAGTNINSSMMIAKGDQDATKAFLQVRRSASDPSNRYVQVKFREFQDHDVMAGVEYITESRVIRYAATFAMDTSVNNQDEVLTVNSNVGYKSLVVFDANQNFNQNSCTVRFDNGQGDFIMDSKNDGYMFFLTGAGQWRYADLNTKNRGVV